MSQQSLIFIVDSNSRRRAEMSSMLTSVAGNAVPFEVPEEISLYLRSPDLVLVHDEDQYLPRATAHLAAIDVDAPIALYGDDPGAQSVVDALRTGASDYLVGPFLAGQLIERLMKTVEVFAPEARRRAVARRARSSLERLSMREREVVSGMADGLTNKLIGRRLGISPRTVEIHRTNALDKLKVDHSSAAIRIAIEAGDLPFN